MSIDIVDEREDGYYAAYKDGRRVGHATWVKVKDAVILPHAEVDPALQGQGIGSLLARRAFDDARAEQHSVMPLCPFMKRWAELHPDYRDITRTPMAGELASIKSAVLAARTLEILHASASPTAHP